MRGAVLTTLQALYEGKEVTANSGLECNTTRVSNEIGFLRNTLNIKIATDRVNTDSGKWYGRYRLIRTPDNIARVKEVLEQYQKRNHNESKGSD